MLRRSIFSVLAILLIGLFFGALQVERAKASGTIYIRADGSIDPPDALIQRDGDIYTLIGNITSGTDGIVIERNNMTLDGASYTLQGNFNGTGIKLSFRSNVTVNNMQIKAFRYGISLNMSLNNFISGNSMTDNGDGFHLWNSSDNTISGNSIRGGLIGVLLYQSSNYNLVFGNNITGSFGYGIYVTATLSSFGLGVTEHTKPSNNSILGNNIMNNGDGIYLNYASNNTISGNYIAKNGLGLSLFNSSGIISGNNITDNEGGIRLLASRHNIISGNGITSNNYAGIWLQLSSNNRVFHNNLINNTNQVYPTDSVNIWDNGYPSGGNYWSNHTGVDSDSDGISDSQHVIDANNTDHYPLMGMFSSLNATSEHHVQTICNSTISEFHHNGTAISFDVTGENGSAGFCRICIPTALMSEYQVFVNGTEVEYNLLPVSNSTHSYLYFTYQHSTKEVVIIPEIPSLILLPLFMLTTLVAAIFYRRKKSKA